MARLWNVSVEYIGGFRSRVWVQSDSYGNQHVLSSLVI